VLEFDGGRDVEKLLADLRKRPEVESVQPIHEFEVLGEPVAGTDPFVGLQHNLEELELVEAHGWSRGAGSRVTIIDTGADIEHPELAPQVVEHADFVSDAGEVFAADAHGTAVAGIIGAVEGNGVGIVGVAPSARLSVLRACWYEEDESGGGAVCDSFTLAKALAHAIDTAPQIINLSLGGPSDPLLSRLLLIAMDRGAIVIAADAGDSEPGFPAGVPGVIVVGSTAGQNALPAVQVLAPGDEILVPTPGGGYDYSSGSSLSAAQVSGIAALLLAMRPALSGADVDRLLLDSRGGGQDYVNACRALARLLGRAGCRDAGRDRTASEAGGQAQYEL
jgi:subtilisin family serine protease